MQFENFDNKVKQAADQHHPNYDEKAWAKMEKLLDKHLPEKKDRRRFIFLLFLLLLSGGGAWLVISKPWQSTDKIVSHETVQQKATTDPDAQSTKEATEKTSSEKKQTDQPVTADNNGTNKTTVPGNKDSKINDKVTPTVGSGIDKSQTGKDIGGVNPPSKPASKKKDKSSAGKISKPEEMVVDMTDPNIAKKNNKPSENIPAAVTGDKKDDDTPVKNSDDTKATDQPVNKTVSAPANSDDKKETVNNEEKKTDDKKADEKSVAKTNKSKKKNILSFSLSAGPDVSSVGLDNPGKVKLLGGIGVGYTIKNKLTIRTGFYNARKIYTAGKYDYKGNVINLQYLERVDANCKVYEIPLSLAYNFGHSEKQNLFASAGLSSYIMKSEAYDYVYKYPGSSQPYIYHHSVNNENKHYFSVISVSAGYQRKISKTFSITAEPYVKVPLSGVGYGKIKLNSAGILFSINATPFQQKSK